MRAGLTVDPEGITDIFRNIALSDRVNRAYQMALDTIEGLTAENAQDLLEGRKTFSSDAEGHTILTEDRSPEAARHHRDLRYIYAGRVRLKGGWYRPHSHPTPKAADRAYAASLLQQAEFLRQDENAYHETLQALVQFRRDCLLRNLGEGQRIVDLSGDRDGNTNSPFEMELWVFEPCSEPPVWWKELGSPRAAVEDFRAAGRRLEDWDEEDLPPVPESRIPTPAPEEDLEAEEEAYERSQKEKFEDLRQRILRQNGDDFLTLSDPDTGVEFAGIPRKPFVAWAMRLGGAGPKWNPVSPVGLKLSCDDPRHSDWMIGAGLDLKGYYGSGLERAAWRACSALQAAHHDGSSTVVVPGPSTFGTVGKEIVVLPDLSPDRLPSILSARAVITEAGGALAHLASVALERGVPIYLVEDAREKYLPGMILRISSDGVISVQD